MRGMHSHRLKIILIISFIGTIAWSTIVMPMGIYRFRKLQGHHKLLDLKPCSSSQEINDYVKTLKPEAAQQLVRIYTFSDRIYPMLYGTFFITSIFYFWFGYKPNKGFVWLLALFPVCMVVTDYIENASIIHLITIENADKGISSRLGF